MARQIMITEYENAWTQHVAGHEQQAIEYF
jgi:hypothetical protein